LHERSFCFCQVTPKIAFLIREKTFDFGRKTEKVVQHGNTKNSSFLRQTTQPTVEKQEASRGLFGAEFH